MKSSSEKRCFLPAAVIAAALAGVLAGCAQQTGTGTDSASGSMTEIVGSKGPDTDSAPDSTESTGTETTAAGSYEDDEQSLVTKASDLDYSEMFTGRDLSGSYDEEEAVSIRLSDDEIETDGKGVKISDDGTVTIFRKGTYVLSGALSDGQVVVNAGDDDKVQIVLDGASITNSDSACIFVNNADKVFVTLAEGTENRLSDTGSEYVQTLGGITVDAVIFSREDLCFNGTGELTIDAGYDQAIVSKDDLKFAGGTYEITSAGKGITGKDSLRIHSGTFSVQSGDDTLHTDNDEKMGRGYVYIEGGDLTLSSGDDGIHAATALIIEGGMIDVTKSYEGLEGDTIDIDGGDIRITASDDGLNAALPSEDADQEDWDMDDGTRRPGAGWPGGGGGMGLMDPQPGACIHITGGTLDVAADGDGLDSNGMITIDGGSVTVCGPVSDMDGAIDTGTMAVINGGTVIASGSSGMAETFDMSSSQYSILYYFSGTVSAGTEVTLTDSAGRTVLSAAPSKEFSSIVLSSPDIAEGKYTVSAGDQSEEITVSSVSTTAGTRSAGRGWR